MQQRYQHTCGHPIDIDLAVHSATVTTPVFLDHQTGDARENCERCGKRLTLAGCKPEQPRNFSHEKKAGAPRQPISAARKEASKLIRTAKRIQASRQVAA